MATWSGWILTLPTRWRRTFKVRIEFIPFDWENLSQLLADDYFDIAMSGIVMLYGSLRKMVFSDAYIYANWAFVVKDHLRTEFASLENIENMEGLTIGLSTGAEAAFDVERHFSNAKAVKLDSVSFNLGDVHK